jgi:glycosyltransferase involved in cell wall biosynthesis
MVQALPVVGTAQPGIVEAIEHERTGLLVDTDNPAALAGALRRVLTGTELARRLGANAQVSVRERFDYRVLLPAVPDALAEAGLISRREPSRSPLGRRVPALEAA